MNIIGNIETSDKFYVLNDDGSIYWTPNLELAKLYVNTNTYKDWFNKSIYCTNEEIVKGYDNKLYLSSKVPSKPKEITIQEQVETFKQQSNDYIQDKLEIFSKRYNFNSFLEMISFYNSSLKDYKKLSKLGISYRDKLYTYTNEYLEKIDGDVDFMKIYKDYLENFPEE